MVRTANSSSSAVGCTKVWWIHGASLAFRAGDQPTKRLLLAHHRSLDCLHVPAKQLPSRAPPVLPSRSHCNGNKRSETQGVRRWAARGQGPSSKVARVCETSSTSGVRSTRRLRVAMLELRPVRCAYPPAERLLWPLPARWMGSSALTAPTKRQYCLLNCLPCCATCNFMKGSRVPSITMSSSSSVTCEQPHRGARAPHSNKTIMKPRSSRCAVRSAPAGTGRRREEGRHDLIHGQQAAA